MVYDYRSVACRLAEKPLILNSSLFAIIRYACISISYRVLVMKIPRTFLALIIVVGSAACSSGGGSGNSPLPADMHNVTYEVTSSHLDNQFMINFIDEDGNTSEFQEIHIKKEPWRYSFTAQTGTDLYLFVKPLSDLSEMYYATIYVDSEIGSTTTGRGGEAVVSFTILADREDTIEYY